MNNKTLEQASAIYLHYFGHLDDKYFQAEKEQEIIDWLAEGEPDDDIKTLIREWGDYDADDIKANQSPIRAAAAVLGSVRSERKAAASRENGKLGGRPRKS